MVSARRERPKFIIRADFLGAHNCDLSLHQKLFTIRVHQVNCMPERAKATRTQLKLARHIKVPAQTEAIVSCKVTQSIKNFGTPHVVPQRVNNSLWYAEDSLVIGSTLRMPDSGIHYLPIMNLSDEPCTLLAGTRIGYVYPAAPLRQTCEMFLADPLLSDWNSDDDDELLLDM